MHKHTLTVAGAFLLAGCSTRSAGRAEEWSSWENLHSNRAVRSAEGSESPAPEREIPNDASLDDLLRFARSHNSGLEASFQRWKAALERIPQATKLPEPRLSLSGYLAEIETRVGPTRGRIGITQRIPWFGELDAQGDIAFQAARAAHADFENGMLELDRKVRDAWYEYARLVQGLAISEGHRELLRHWESVARARMETGLTTHSDVIRAQVELGRLEDRVLTLRDLQRPMIAGLNAALNRPSGARLPRPRLSESIPRAPFDDELLLAELADSSPVLRAMEHHIEAARHALRRARTDSYPDFVVGVDYTFIGRARSSGVRGSGEDAAALTLALDLPLWRDAYRAGNSEKEALLKRAYLEKEEALNRISSELEMALYRFRDASRRVDLFQDSLVPKGEEAVQALDIAYQSGDEGFLDLIDAQRVLLDFRLQVARAEADRAKALAEIETLTGRALH